MMRMSLFHFCLTLFFCLTLTACGKKTKSEPVDAPKKTATPTLPDDGDNGGTNPPDGDDGNTNPPDDGGAGNTDPDDNGGGGDDGGNTIPPDDGGSGDDGDGTANPPDDGGSGTNPPGLSCADNYLLIAANAQLGTESFCIAKYEMKTGAATFQFDGKTYPQPVSTIYGSSQASVVAGHFYGGNKDGSNFSLHRTEAVAACRSLGENYDLVSNAQWMAVARDIENEAWNWSGGAVGKGALSRGNSSGSIQPDGVDSNPCANTESACDLESWSQHRRIHKLHGSGNLIWDFAGNTKEWVLDGTPDPTQQHLYSEFMYKLFAWSSFGPQNDYSNEALYPDFDRNNGGHLGYYTIWSVGSAFTRGGNATNSVTNGAAPGIYSMQQVNLTYNPSGGKYQGEWGIGFRCIHK